MSQDLPPLTWGSLLTTWDVTVGWTALCVVVLAGYVFCVLKARAAGNHASIVRAASFMAGVALLWLTVSSGVAVYGMVLFWMHMVVHLTLIMVVPALLVLGHPLTALRDALEVHSPRHMWALARSRPVSVGTHPLVGLAAYSVTIVATHLTSFMDQMASRPWLATVEEVVYILAGLLFLLPVLGAEPIRWQVPWLGRLALLVVAMVPDTVVGLVLLQSQDNPFPRMLPGTTWGPSPVRDVQIGGALMWAGGDAIMMTLAVALVLALVSGHGREEMLGGWLESARRSAVVGSADDQDGEAGDIDGDEALLAVYNSRLARLNQSADERARD